MFTDSLKLSFDFASDELAESVVTHEILPQLVCATIHRLGWVAGLASRGRRPGKMGFFLIEMDHLYKMMSVVWLMALTVDELIMQPSIFFGYVDGYS